MSLKKTLKDLLIVDETSAGTAGTSAPVKGTAKKATAGTAQVAPNTAYQPVPVQPVVYQQPPPPEPAFAVQPAFNPQQPAPMDPAAYAYAPPQPVAQQPVYQYPPQPAPPQPPAYYPPAPVSPRTPAPLAASPLVAPTAPSPSMAWQAPSAIAAPSPRVTAPAAPILPSNVSLEQINTIYQEQGIAQAPYAAEQALRFLSSFPDDQLDANRRAALLGLIDSLRPTLPGLSLESLAEDASNKIAVLEQTGNIRSEKFKKFEADTELEIESLRGQIQQRREAVEVRRVQDQQIAQLCMEHAERLRKLVALLA